MLVGQYNKPQRVVAFNVVEGLPRDSSEDIAKAVANLVQREGDLPVGTPAFIEEQLGDNWNTRMYEVNHSE